MKLDSYRYTVSRFDTETFVVVDRATNREICVCSDYDDYEDAEKRAEQITNALNLLCR